MSSFTGPISDFCNPKMFLRIYSLNIPEQSYCLKLHDTERNDVIQLDCDKFSYRTTREKAKQHIFDAIEMAFRSSYKDTYCVEIHIPMYPYITVPLERCEEVKDVVKRAMENFF